MQRVTTRRTFYLSAACLAVLVVTGSQCASVDDSVTGPRSDTSGAVGGTAGTVAACVRACNEAASAARDAESDLHRENLKACGPANSDCRQAEAARHAAAIEQIVADQEACKTPCHEQGGGSGGQ
jgi:hypothetical protein